MNISYCLADYQNPVHTGAIVQLVNCLSMDPVGAGAPLKDSVAANLVPNLQKYPQCFSMLALDGELGVGLALCFETLSSFKARPVVNIHDFVVRSSHRGHGIAKQLLQCVEAEAHRRNACKLTLEVLENNQAARNLYAGFGFQNYELIPENGVAQFWEKPLISP